MDQLLSLVSFVLVSLNVALDSGSREGTIAYDRLLPIHCLHETVHALVSLVYSNEQHNNRPRGVPRPRSTPSIRLLNILAVLAFCASLFQDGRVWHKLLTANAMLCWLLRTTANQPAPAPAMTSTLIWTLLEHSAVFVTTDYFDPNDLHCWKWLATTSAPIALMSCLFSRPRPEGRQQEPEMEVIAGLLHIPSLCAIWLFGFSPVAKRHFALPDPRWTTFHGLDQFQIMVVGFNTWALICCIVQREHRMAGRTWPTVMTALLYAVMVGFFYLVCYPLY